MTAASVLMMRLGLVLQQRASLGLEADALRAAISALEDRQTQPALPDEGAPVTKTDPQPREAPIGPDGKPMTDEDRVLFGHTLPDE